MPGSPGDCGRPRNRRPWPPAPSEQTSLRQCLTLALLLHVLAVVLIGTAAGDGRWRAAGAPAALPTALSVRLLGVPDGPRASGPIAPKEVTPRLVEDGAVDHAPRGASASLERHARKTSIMATTETADVLPPNVRAESGGPGPSVAPAQQDVLDQAAHTLAAPLSVPGNAPSEFVDARTDAKSISSSTPVTSATGALISTSSLPASAPEVSPEPAPAPVVKSVNSVSEGIPAPRMPPTVDAVPGQARGQGSARAELPPTGEASPAALPVPQPVPEPEPVPEPSRTSVVAPPPAAHVAPAPPVQNPALTPPTFESRPARVVPTPDAHQAAPPAQRAVDNAARAAAPSSIATATTARETPVATPIPQAASAPEARPLNLQLYPGRPFTGSTPRPSAPGLLQLLPPPAERKSKLTQGIERAAKPDCRKAYTDKGVLAAVPLINDALRGDDKGCRW